MRLAAVLLVFAACAAMPARGEDLADALMDAARATDDGLALDLHYLSTELGFADEAGAVPKPARGRIALTTPATEVIAVLGDGLATGFTATKRGPLPRSPYLALAADGHGVLARRRGAGKSVAAAVLAGDRARLAAVEGTLGTRRMRLIVQGGYLHERNEALGARLDQAGTTGFAGAAVDVAPAPWLDMSLGWHEGRTRTADGGAVDSRAVALGAEIRRRLLADGRLSLSLGQDLTLDVSRPQSVAAAYAVPLPLGTFTAEGAHDADSTARLRLMIAFRW